MKPLTVTPDGLSFAVDGVPEIREVDQLVTPELQTTLP